jgi:chemotaxis protein MotA
MLVDGTIRPDDFEAVLDTHVETHHEEAARGASVLTKLGDSLPGLGIVAAVLGIVITMQHVDGKPAEIGHHVAVALVGTFLGILLSYGYVQPLAANLESQAMDATRFLRCMKGGLVAFARGAPPLVAVEIARHVIFSGERPHAEELSEACRTGGSRA